MSAGPPTRPSLVGRLRDRNDRATWTEFVGLYAPVVFGFARKAGLQDADAADLTQEVLRSVVGAITRFDYTPARGGFRAWLFQITRNHVHSFRRGTARAARLTARAPGAPTVPLEEVPAHEEALEAAWEQEWRRELFARACGHVRPLVEPATWEAFHQTAVLGRAGQQVAAELGLSVAAVYLAKSRVLARLRQFVQAAEEE
ncbi:sigma-70 family RNA polymerase sigma factor [Gemmata sp. JC673]|uniref:Sigma-70 family RNA polymerase sigma factor n=1 Tax=Gemmata algarum TaxID=2975278 RepID=A0ABU5EVQ4_9BACT|nr:sigma-70 family RNA polymerase sigma factor [Gemmata algarum]MDY3557714.1 sigma-70 family RNA polymerase sigma factor [Gemmata algarum]